MSRRTGKRSTRGLPWWVALHLLASAIGCVSVGCVATQPDSLLDDVVRKDSTPDPLPGLYEFELGQLRFHSDLEIPVSHRLIVELHQLQATLANDLGVTPTQEPIHIYLFATAQRFQHYAGSLGNSLSSRRAFFVQTDTTLSVYAIWSDDVATDLRHEVTHAYLHSVVPRLPLWLDEGIAEYYEVPPGQGGWHPGHARHLASQSPAPLEHLEQVQDPAKMTQHDYASSWAWVHYLQQHDDPSRAALRNQLEHWRHASEAPRLSLQMKSLGTGSDSLVAHLKRHAPTR